ncbi:MAG: hypothetical protein EXQ56_04175 [Acidobacteria bacterium]|nr:hypothetical protein [Acidobacteriota bacterium]
MAKITKSGGGWMVQHSIVCLLLALGSHSALPSASAAELQSHTIAAWEKYVRLTEQRIESELRGAADGPRFLVVDFNGEEKATALRDTLRRGEIHIQKIQTRERTQEIAVDDGMIHHWMGATFVPGIKLESLLKWVKDYAQHEKFFPEIERSRLLSNDGDTYKVYLRLKRKKIITVVYNTEHSASYFPQSATRVVSKSFTTRIAQVEDAGTSQEKELPIGQDGGYLWRLNSYWRFEERDGGVYVECESISLSRGIPFGVGWMIRGLVDSLPRESLLNTLTPLRDGVRRSQIR